MFAKKSSISSFFRKCTVSLLDYSLLCLWLWNNLPTSIICLSVWCYSLFKLLQSLPTTQHIYELSLTSCPMFVTTCSTEFWKWKKGLSSLLLRWLTWKGLLWDGRWCELLLLLLNRICSKLLKIRIITRVIVLYSPKKFDILQLYIKFVLWTNLSGK